MTSRHIIGGQLDLGNAYLISQADFDAINKRSKVDQWDVLVSMIGTVGEPCLIKEEPNFAIKNIGLFKSKGEAEGRWLYYYLRSPDAQQRIRELSRGTTQQYIPLGALREFPVLVPYDHDEMRAIAYILGTLDDKIELNRRMTETLEAIARALFRFWFVDFDPVRAKAEGCDPGLPKPLADLFPDSFEESELGEIPTGWRVATLGDLCRRVAIGPFGSDIKTDNFVESGVPVVRGGNLTRGFVDEGFVFLSEAKADELRNANAFPGDIVITHRGTLGQIGLVPKASRFPRYVVSQSQMLLSVNPDLATPRYIFEYLRSPVGQHALLASTSQTGVPALARPTSSLRAIRMLQPPIPALASFEQILDPFIERGNRATEETRTLATLRDTLLPKLISGDLRVKDPARFLEGVVA